MATTCLRSRLLFRGYCNQSKSFIQSISTVSPNRSVPPRSIIIGGGVIGLTTALRLAEKGSQVTVLEEADSTAHSNGASYCNGAILCPSMAASWACAKDMYTNKGEVKRMKVSLNSFLQPDFYRWSFWFWFNSLMPGRSKYNHESARQLAHYSLICMEKEIENYGEALAFNKTSKDTIKLYHNEKHLTDFLVSDAARFWKDKGWEFERLTVEQCYQLEPTLADKNIREGVLDNRDFVGGVLFKFDSSGEVHTYCKNLEKQCQNLGVDIQCGKRVKALETKAGEMTGIRMEDGDVLTADAYVLAVGAASPGIGKTAGVNLPVHPLKGHIVTVTSNPGQPILTRNIYSPKHGLVAALSPNLLRISGGVEAAGYNHTVDEEQGRQLVKRIEGVFKEGYIDMSKPQFHSCLRPVCADDVPIIGQTHIPNLYVNTGHGSKGWTYCWGSSAFLAELMCGEQTVLDSERYSPLRFHPMRRLVAK